LFTPLVGLVLGHRMVVREYQAHTHLFLEGLPIRRWEMVVAK
jgi:ABC-type transport system involved in multi-copper enzyme maturation permease subunit